MTCAVFSTYVYLCTYMRARLADAIQVHSGLGLETPPRSHTRECDIYIYTHIHLYIDIYIYTYIPRYTYVCVCVPVCMYACVYL